MPMTPSRYEPGVWHHITIHTAARQPLFADANHARTLQGQLNQARKRFALLVAAYVIMPDHVHWLIYPTESGFEDFAAGQLQRGGRYAHDPAAHYVAHMVEYVKRGTSQSILRLARTLSDQIWQSGFWDKLIDNLTDLPEIVDRIHLNPVRAGLCDHAKAYPYSSYNAIVYDHPHIVVVDRSIWENFPSVG